MIVGFDGTIFLTPKTGVGYYTQFLMHYLTRECPDIKIRMYDGLRMRAHDPHLHDDGTTGSAARPVASLRRFSSVRAGWRAFKAAGFRRAARRLDLFHATNYLTPARTDIPVLPLIHDVSHLRYPEWHPGERVRFLNSRSNEFSKARLVNTVSKFSASEIEATLGIPMDRIRVTYPGVNPRYARPPRDAAGALKAMDVKAGKFFLCVGTLEPRKNLATAIAAFASLPAEIQDSFPLLVAGPKGWGDLDLSHIAERLERAGRLRFVGYVDEETMHVLYQECATFLFPSFYEGFGMPVSEAMATGTRPIVTAGGAPDEIAGGLGVGLPGLDVEAWSLAMKRAIDEDWYGDSRLRAQLKERSSRFNWTDNARATLALYDALVD